MPTYEYLCEKCGHRFEKFQQMTDEPVKECPRCGKRPRRLIGIGSGIIFKGPGFYATDYRSPPPKEEKKSPSGEKASSEGDKNKKSSASTSDGD